MEENKILKAYEAARERYAELGIDTDKAVAQLEQVPISLHCWQTDDVVGFERNVALSGGIQTTGNYPGRARNVDEVRQDIIEVKSLLAGNHRLNLHETAPHSPTRRAATSHSPTPTTTYAASGLSTQSAAAASQTQWARHKATHA